MTDVLLIASVIAVMIIAGFTLENHSKKTKQQLMDELNDEAILNDESIMQPGPTLVVQTPEVEAPAPTPEVEQLVESPEEAPAPKPAKKRRRGRPAAKKD
tara:strand:- start:1648 stop:1947 length:300 start_codon:yes stop_codon:yes gene_type:complete